MHKNKLTLFLLKNCKYRPALGPSSQTPLSPRRSPQTPNGLQQLGVPPPDPNQTPTQFRNPGYATGHHQFNALLKHADCNG